MLTITPFKTLYPGDPLGTPTMRAAILGHTGAAFLQTTKLLQEHPIGFTFISVVIPSMQQSIELLVKSIAVKNILGFDPRSYGHNILDIVDAHAAAIPVFAKHAASQATRDLFLQLTDGYLAVRYGEAHVKFDEETWNTFCSVADELVAIACPTSATDVAGTA